MTSFDLLVMYLLIMELRFDSVLYYILLDCYITAALIETFAAVNCFDKTQSLQRELSFFYRIVDLKRLFHFK